MTNKIDLDKLSISELKELKEKINETIEWKNELGAHNFRVELVEFLSTADSDWVLFDAGDGAMSVNELINEIQYFDR